MTLPVHPAARTGAIAPLTALFLIALMGTMAFAIDLGWVVLVQSDLQSAADASALAGANALMDGYVQFNLAGTNTTGGSTNLKQSVIISDAQKAAIAAAKNYATHNNAGVASLNLNDSDVQFGYTDLAGKYTTPTPSGKFPNTVRVTMRRDGNANGALGLFFGPVLGKPTTNLTASAAATIHTTSISGFKNVPGFHAGLLPVTYDYDHWFDFVETGKNPDGGTTSGSDGLPTLQIYPSIKFTGNFGILSLDGSHSGASELKNWVDNGMSQSDLANLQSVSDSSMTPLIPLSAHNKDILPSQSNDGKGSWNWIGDPGMKTSVIHTIADYVGDTFLLPLYKPLSTGEASDSSSGSGNNGNGKGGGKKSGGSNNGGGNTSEGYLAGNGQGANYYYNIIEFVSVKIISADNANKGGVVVQPSPIVLDFNHFSLMNTAPAGETTNTTFTFVPAKLTQ